MTNTPTYEIETKFLKTAMLYSARSEARYYLQTVAIFKRKDFIRIVATNGHILFCAMQKIEPDYNNHYEKDFDKLIPLDELKRSLTGYNKNFASTLRLDMTPGNPDIVLNGFSFKETEGTYPDITRIIPEEISNEVAQFDTKYLDVLQKSCKALEVSTNGSKIYHNGNNPALISFGLENCFALFMPVRPGAVHNVKDTTLVSQIKDIAGCTGPAAQYSKKTKNAA